MDLPTEDVDSDGGLQPQPPNADIFLFARMPFVAGPRERSHRQRIKTPSLLRWRELGSAQIDSCALSGRQIAAAIESAVVDTYKDWAFWERTSKDVLTAIWAPDGRHFAAGASANLDARNIQYNDRVTLLFGDVERNVVTELDDHTIERPAPTVPLEPERLPDAQVTADHRLWTTVTSICFNKTGEQMFTGSYDKTVKVWDVSEDRPVCTQTLLHDVNVQLVEYCSAFNLLATAQDSFDGPIRLYQPTDSGLTQRVELFSQRAKDLKFTPTCLRFGPSQSSQHLLLAGFSENNEDEFEPQRDGDLCLWDMATSQRMKLWGTSHMIFDVAWHPRVPYFAAALAPGSGTTLTDRRRTRSLIRTWKPQETINRIYEFECEAADVNDVQFHPYNDHYISASCTDGKTSFGMCDVMTRYYINSSTAGLSMKLTKKWWTSMGTAMRAR